MCSKGLSPFLGRSGVPEAGPLPSELEVRAGGGTDEAHPSHCEAVV